MSHWLSEACQPPHIDGAPFACHIAIEVERERHGDHTEGEERKHGQKTEDVPQPPLPAGIVERGLPCDWIRANHSVKLSSRLVDV